MAGTFRKNDLSGLLALQRLDLELDKSRPALEKIPVMIARLGAQLEVERGRAAKTRGPAAALEDRRRQKRLQLAEENEAVGRFAAELATAAGRQARSSLETELGFARQAAGETEAELSRLTREIESCLQVERAALGEFSAEEGRFKAAISAHGERLAKLREQFDAAKARRDAAAASIPADALRVYEHLRSRGKPDAVAPVDGEVCGACRIRLAPQTLVEATTLKGLVCCESCQRILYRE